MENLYSLDADSGTAEGGRRMSKMTAIEYMKIKSRITRPDNYGECDIPCDCCPLSSDNNGKGVLCTSLELKYPEEAVAIVQKWAEEHPVKTLLQDFFEKFPKAKKDKDGTPTICPEEVYGGKRNCLGYKNCQECWNRPLEES